jgi:hypothetical protein
MLFQSQTKEIPPQNQKLLYLITRLSSETVDFVQKTQNFEHNCLYFEQNFLCFEHFYTDFEQYGC